MSPIGGRQSPSDHVFQQTDTTGRSIAEAAKTDGLMNSGRPGLEQVGMNLVDRLDLLVEFGPS